MPAHCTVAHDGIKVLSDGQPLTQLHRRGNDAVDELAKAAARQDAPPSWQLRAVARATDRLTAIATWIGQSAALANHFPLPEQLSKEGCSHIRDAEGTKRRASRPRSASAAAVSPALPLLPPGPRALLECPRWVALRERVRCKERTARDQRGALPGD